MELAVLIVSFGVLVVSGIAAAAAVVQARAAAASVVDARHARDEALTARDEAVQQANEFLRRQAEAQEEQVRLQKAAIPEPTVSFTIRQLSDSKYVVVNTGDLEVKQVLVEGIGIAPEKVVPSETEPRDLGKGDGIAFFVSRAMSPGEPTVRVSWLEDSGERDGLDRVIH